MTERVALGRRLPATLAALGAVYTASAAIVWSGLAAREPAVAAGVTLDLTVTAAAIVWLGLVRARRWPAWALVPVAGAGAVVARAVVPGAGALLELLATAWIAVEVALFVVVVGRVRRLVRGVRARRAAGVVRLDAFEGALAEVSGSPRLAAIIAAEIGAVALATSGWWRPAARAAPGRFPLGRRRDWQVLLGVLGFLLVVETLALHVALATVSPIAAWLATGTSLYALLWLVAEAHAVRTGVVALDARGLRAAVGVRWRFAATWDQIAAVRLAADRPPAAGAATAGAATAEAVLDASQLGGNVVVELHAPITVRGPLGIVRHARAIALTVEDPAALVAAASASAAAARRG